MKKSEQTEWRITYHGGFWDQHGRSGTEIAICKSFPWSGYIWHIPAVYACGDGLVMDLCIEVDPESIRSFLDKWYPILQEDPHPSEAIRQAMEAENPTSLPHFHAKVRINGKESIFDHMQGISWIPEDCFPESIGDRPEAKRVLTHYALDENRGWVFRRVYFPWPTKRKPVIRKLSLTLEQLPQCIPGAVFPTPEPGQSITAVHPITGTAYTLTVTEVKQEVLEISFPNSETFDWPRNCVTMAYTLTPELTRERFLLRDTVQSDAPRQKSEPAQPSGGAESMAIIGGSDGPTAIFLTRKDQPVHHSAISSLHFEPAEQVVWKLDFRHKLVEDFSIALI